MSGILNFTPKKEKSINMTNVRRLKLEGCEESSWLLSEVWLELRYIRGFEADKQNKTL